MKKNVKKQKLRKLLLDSGKIRPEWIDMIVDEIFKKYNLKVPVEIIAERIIKENTGWECFSPLK